MEIHCKSSLDFYRIPIEIQLELNSNFNAIHCKFNKISIKIHQNQVKISMKYQWNSIKNPFEISMKYQSKSIANQVEILMKCR